MYPATKILSSADVILLEKDIRNLDLAKKVCLIAFPLFALLCALSWYFWFYGVIIFLSTALTVMSAGALIASVMQGKNIRKDLQENYKIVEHFVVEKKYVLTDGKKATIITEDYLANAAAYKEALDKIDNPTFIQRNSTYDETLRRSFYFTVKTNEKETKDFIVPIKYYIKFKEGDSITIEYAQHSKKVLHVS